MRATAMRFRILPFVLILVILGVAAAPARAQTTVAGVTPGALAVDQTGQANYSIPIDVPPGIAGMEPSLSLDYSSGGGNGIAGVGWSLGGLSAITRCPRTPAQDGQWGAIEYSDDDRFCLDGKRLIAVAGTYGADGTEYRTEIDGMFRVVSYGKVTGSIGVQGSSPVWFRVWAKTGQIMDYGATEDSRIEAVFTPAPPAGTPPEVRAWAVDRIADTIGNYLTFTYFEDTAAGAHRLDRIDYAYNDAAAVAAQSAVEFVYEARPDTAQGYPGRSLLTSDVRLAAIRTHTDGALVRDYRLAYETGAATGRSRLLSVTECDGIGGTESCLQPTVFGWKPESAGFTSDPAYIPPADSGLVDVNGDGLLDAMQATNTLLNTGAGWEDFGTYVPPSIPGAPAGEFLDLNGDGLVDYIVASGTDHASYQTVWLNNGSGWEENVALQPPFLVESKWSTERCNSDGDCTTTKYHEKHGSFVDVDGDGRIDFVRAYTGGTAAPNTTWLNTESGWQVSGSYQAPFDIFSGKSIKVGGNLLGSGGETKGQIHENGRFLDVNGDGRSDFVQAVLIESFEKTTFGGTTLLSSTSYRTTWLNTGSGWQESALHQAPFHIARYWTITTTCKRDCFPPPPTYHANTHGEFADANADGSADFVQAYKGGVRTAWLNMQSGWLESPTHAPPFDIFVTDVATPDTKGGRQDGWLIDVNGDGLTDLLRAVQVTTRTWGPTVMNRSTDVTYRDTWLNTGSGWHEDILYKPQFNTAKYSVETYCNKDDICNTTYRSPKYGGFIDVNSDGLLDFVESGVGDNGILDSWLANSAAPDQLLSVTDSLDATAALSWLPLTDPAVHEKYTDAAFPVLDIQAPMYVVSEVAGDDGVGGQARTAYRYAGAKVDTTGRGFLGFRLMEATDAQTGIVTVTAHAQAFPFIGQVEATETYIPDPTGLTEGTRLSRTTDTLAQKPLNAGATAFPYVSQSIAEGFEFAHGHGNTPVTTSTTTSTYDDFGNPTRITVSTTDGAETFTTDTVNIYTNDTVNWYLGRVTRATVTNTLPDTRSATRVSSFAYDPVTGLLNREVIEPDTPALRLVTDYGHDVFGHVTTATVSGADIATRSTTTDYPAAAPNYGRFATSATNALGHTETRTYDARFGAVTSVTGPNLITTSWQYDGFGRKTRAFRADGTATAWLYGFATNPEFVYFVQKKDLLLATGAAISPIERVNYDLLNRAARTRAHGFDGTLVFVRTRFNALGQVEKVSRPFFAGTPQAEKQWTVTTYDGIGRVKTVTAPDGGVRGVAYDGFTTVATNALAQTETRIRNAIGQLVRVTDHDGASVINTYDPFGNLESSRAAGVETTMTYDIRGRKRTMFDPDMGVWSYAYDVLGELVSQTDAKGQTVTMTYDLLGRMKTRSEAEGLTTWTYDNAFKTAAIGKPDRVSRTEDDYVEDYTYDALGRPAETVVTYGGRGYAATTTYDAAGRVATLTYPAAADGSRFAVENVYTSLGYLESVQEPGGLGPVYWRALQVNAAGQVTEEELGNGLVTQRGFDPATGLVQTIGTYDGITPLQDLEFGFDKIGNLRARTDRMLGREETFTYDNLNRLKITTLTDTATLAVIDESLVNYDPDGRGNITFKSDVGGYIYNGIDGGPHAVTRAGNVEYIYDANGAMISAAFADTGTSLRSFTWSSFHKPTRIEGAGGILASEFVYGPSRARVRQTTFEGAAVTKTITYLGAFERHETQGAADELVHYISAGGTVAIFTKVDDSNPNTDRLRYLHKDHLGSVALVTDETGAIAESRSFDPWGRARNADWSAAGADVPLIETKRGFTGHEHLDTVGLIHMNGRVYDPVIGRMVSADPIIQAPTNTQSHNRYTYVMNNPLSFTDPSGFGWWSNSLGEIAKPFRALFRAIRRLLPAIVQIVIPIVACMYPGATLVCGMVAGGITSGVMTMAQGGDLTDGLMAAAVAVASIKAMDLVGGYFGEAPKLSAGAKDWAKWHAVKAVAHGVVGGVASVLRRGKFLAGFLSGAAAQVSSGLVGLIKGGGVGAKMARTMAAAVAGGAGAVLGGGKFANGAITGAFQRLFNHEIDHDKDLLIKARDDNTTLKGRVGFFGALGGKIWGFFKGSIDIDLGSLEIDMTSENQTYRYGIEGQIDIVGVGVEFQFMRGTHVRSQPNLWWGTPSIVSDDFTFFDAQFVGPGTDTKVFELPGFVGGKIGFGVGAQASFDPVGWYQDITPVRHNNLHRDPYFQHQ